jgi:hypothetical protein
MPTHRQELLALEEALPRRRLLELADYRHPQEFAVLVSDLEHPIQPSRSPRSS